MTPFQKQSITATPPIADPLSVKVSAKSLLKLPSRISIPSLKIDAKIEHLGLTKDGAVDSPVGPDNVGWFNKGPIPGEIGNAIMDGHSGWKNNIPAVFDNLKELKAGDKIDVENGSGSTITFVVTKLKIYSKDDAALDVFNSTDGKAHLNLITCTGTWNTLENGRESRMVVFTDLYIE